MNSTRVQRDSLQPEACSLKPVFADRLGSRRGDRARGTGTALTRSNYYPFGEEIATTDNNTYKFASTYRDQASSLDYAVNRYYSSGTGRFTTVDPAGCVVAKSRTPQLWDAYSYGMGDPVNQTNPSGQWPCGAGGFGWDEPFPEMFDMDSGDISFFWGGACSGGGGGGGGSYYCSKCMSNAQESCLADRMQCYWRADKAAFNQMAACIFSGDPIALVACIASIEAGRNADYSRCDDSYTNCLALIPQKCRAYCGPLGPWI